MLYQLSYEATHIGSEVKLLSSYLPVQWNVVKFIWNNSYLYCSCTCRWKWRVIIAVNFPIWAIGKKKPEKKNRASMGLELSPPRYRCDALPNELWSHTLGARSIYWVHIFPCSEMMKETSHYCLTLSSTYTLDARGFSCVISSVGQVSVVTHMKNLWNCWELDFFDSTEPMTSQFKFVWSRIWSRKHIGS